MKFALTLNAGYNEYQSPYDALEHSYITYFENLGITCIPLSNAVSNLRAFLRLLDVQGIILTGGNNVSPTMYGQETLVVKGVSESRDRVETGLLRIAVEDHLPVLGICRGMQFINVFFGGSLIQDVHLKEHSFNHAGSSHINKIVDATAARLLGAAEMMVNSFHRQGVTVDSVSPILRIFATSEDQLIEGVFHPNYPVLGIQWHPERPGSSAWIDSCLIHSFLQRDFWKVE